MLLFLRKSSEPVSPIITFAVCKLNKRKPRQEPTTIEPNIVISFTSNIIARTVKNVIIIALILLANPSTPSVRLTAFVVPNITKIANGI